MRPAPIFGLALGLALARTASAQPPPPAPAATFAPEPPGTAPAPPGTVPAPPPPAPSPTQTEPLAPADPSAPPVAETPVAPPAPPPAEATPPPPPEEPEPPPPPIARNAPRAERTLYANISALLAIHVRAARYDVEVEDGQAQREQTLGGGGYELVGMLGSAKNGFAFGGGASFVYVGKTDYTWEGEDLPGYHPPIWALSLGPAVDYHPGRRFHIGGLVGLALESVPTFEPLPRKRETVPGLAMALWLGFEWAVSDDWNLGVCMTGHLRQSFQRDISPEPSSENSEASLSIGLGVNVSRF